MTEFPRRDWRQERRQKILASAAELFGANPYDSVQMRDVAARAEVGKPTLYRYFPSKEELFLALLEERLVGQLEGVEHAFEQTAPPERQSEVAAQLFLESLERDARWAPLFFEFVAYCARDPGRRAHFAERFLHTARQLLSRVIERRYDQLGVDPPMRPDELAICIDALANGIVIERLFDPESVPDDLLGRAVALLTRPSG